VIGVKTVNSLLVLIARYGAWRDDVGRHRKDSPAGKRAQEQSEQIWHEIVNVLRNLNDNHKFQ